MRRKNYISRIIFLFVIIAHTSFAEDEKLAEVFAKSPVAGSMVVEHLESKKRYVYNPARAKQPFTVASTFKIPNTLIALQAGVATNAETRFKWNGTDYWLKSWNKDQTLASAFQVSCVWCYQQIAQQVGAERYKAYIKSMDYGTLPDAFDVENFWLDGTLKLSAEAQVNFLKKLQGKTLPFEQKHFALFKTIMLAEQTATYKLYGKTGWAPQGEAPVGWYVGYVESENGTWVFALNLALKQRQHLALRKQLAKEALISLGAIPAPQ
ncbi:class D beta-lactamase [Thalassotalea agarivorans]|uniref:beta-lactamase n=1 Tax=Thalassotalea agarivorans TaxID=349064 RepID=A0A1I0ENQ8_THASX|nr:class D beta-lactamase [Thalassotalea agarivorans]SET46372.1 beta-lactamase class D [Thalassotalea agarivorans]